MNKLNLVLGLALLSSSAFAAPAKDPASTGQFRRAEAIKAAGADAKTARVENLTTANNRIYKSVAQPANARILFVSDQSGKVSVVNAPMSKSEKVTKMTTAEVNAAGLVTQAQAKKIASRTEQSVRPIQIANDGMGAKRGSYAFKQTAPSIQTDRAGTTYRYTAATRTVSVTGKGESVTKTTYDQISPIPAK